MVYETLILVGRVLFGGYFAFNGLNHFMKRDMMEGYAGSKGVPYPAAAVILSGLMLLAGGFGIALGVYPVVSITLVALFLLFVTPVMHDFWEVEEEEKMQEMTSFMKNVALFGAVLTLLGADWSLYSLALGLNL